MEYEHGNWLVRLALESRDDSEFLAFDVAECLERDVQGRDCN